MCELPGELPQMKDDLLRGVTDKARHRGAALPSSFHFSISSPCLSRDPHLSYLEPAHRVIKKKKKK